MITILRVLLTVTIFFAVFFMVVAFYGCSPLTEKDKNEKYDGNYFGGITIEPDPRVCFRGYPLAECAPYFRFEIPEDVN